MNEIGWFVAGGELAVIGACALLIWSAYDWTVKATREMEEASRQIERDGREIEEYIRRRGKDAETIEELEENQKMLYEAAGFHEDAEFMDVVRLIKKHKQDSEEYAAARERASKIFITEPGV